MARCSGPASGFARHTGAVFTAVGRLLFAAGERRRGCGAQAGGLLVITRGKIIMPKYVIEREIPGAGKLTPQDLQGISQKSCSVLQNLGPQIQWVESYVTDDKVYCVYIAPSEDMIRAHAQQGGFPANKISEIRTTIDPTTAE